jgi:hypothetical protein
LICRVTNRGRGGRGGERKRERERGRDGTSVPGSINYSESDLSVYQFVKQKFAVLKLLFPGTIHFSVFSNVVHVDEPILSYKR